MVAFLLDPGANKDAISSNRKTALIRAAENGYAECTELLLHYDTYKEETLTNGPTARKRSKITAVRRCFWLHGLAMPNAPSCY
jgi:ankyrin repeat protein